MENYTFECVKEEHIEELRTIYLYYIKHSTVTFHKREISMVQMRDLVLIKHPKYESHVIRYLGEICGYVILAQYKTREAFEYTAEVTIYLKQGFEGKGIGGGALNFIEQRANAKDLHVLVALICGENKQSIRLFEKYGYEKCAHYKEVGYKFDRWLDLVCYQKIVNIEKELQP